MPDPTPERIAEIEQRAVERALKMQEGSVLAREVERLRAEVERLSAECNATADSLMEVAGQRVAALEIHYREDGFVYGGSCAYCRDSDEDPMPWPCPTAKALGVATGTAGARSVSTGSPPDDDEDATVVLANLIHAAHEAVGFACLEGPGGAVFCYDLAARLIAAGVRPPTDGAS